MFISLTSSNNFSLEKVSRLERKCRRRKYPIEKNVNNKNKRHIPEIRPICHGSRDGPVVVVVNESVSFVDEIVDVDTYALQQHAHKLD